MLYLFLGDGFEEIEALTVVDLLRRAECEIATVSVMGTKSVLGAHGIRVEADLHYDEADFSNADMLILPGGMGGVHNLSAHAGLMALLQEKHDAGVTLAAICAAPMILAKQGLLNGVRATIYPALHEELACADYCEDTVVKCGSIITSRGPATAVYFALALIEERKGAAMAAEIKRDILL